MNRLFALLLTYVFMSVGYASSAIPLLPVTVDVGNQAALQRGARIYMNYCSGCHALRYMRYDRMAIDLGLTTFAGQLDTDLLRNNLVFTEAKIQDPIQISMPPDDARQWFGKVPPDLSLTAREHGADWLYTYLKSFYADNKRPFGANNLVLPDVAMPNILAPLQGQVVRMGPFQDERPRDILSLVLLKPGEMSPHQFDSMLTDLVTFLVYVGEPAQLQRRTIGWYVLAFLLGLVVITYQLKKAYWKKID